MDGLQKPTEELRSVHGKRKAEPPQSTAPIIDLTCDDDNTEPAVKRKKIQSIKVNNDDQFGDLRQHRATDGISSHVPAKSSRDAHFSSTISSHSPYASSRSALPIGRKIIGDTNGNAYFVNEISKSSSWKSPTPGGIPTNPTGVPPPHSDAERNLQSFRLPKATSIKFEPEVTSSSRLSLRAKPPEHVRSVTHEKKRSYDQADVERVKSIFSPSASPNSSIKLTKVSAITGDRRQRPLQRVSQPSQHPGAEPCRPLKPLNLPSRTAQQNAKIPQREDKTPPRLQISVVVPLSQPKSTKLTLTPNHKEDQANNEKLLQSLKRDVNVARLRARSVEKYFGTTGFSDIYGTASDEQRSRKLHHLQPKAKKIKRREVKLDWGFDDVAGQTQPREINHPQSLVKAISNSAIISATTGPPVTFVNDVDDRQINGKFQFISKYVFREGVKRQPRQLSAHMNCRDTCNDSCSPHTCSCLQNDRIGQSLTIPTYAPTYRHHPNGAIVLDDELLVKREGLRSEIMECNNNCSCGPACHNRVVQRGRTLPLEIFMTRTCGFGLRCPESILKGQFIDVYLGEVVTENMLVQRESAAEEGEPSYIFSLDWFNEGKVSPNFYHVDGVNFGTPMRFVNHSCNANCGVFTVMLQEYDQNIYGLAVFALKDIRAMTELTLDYAPSPNMDDDDDEDFGAERVRCQCGEDNCRGWLWPKNTNRGRRRKMARG